MNKLMRRIICSIRGHAKIEKHLTETEDYINTERCSRCKSIMLSGHNIKFKQISPPNSTTQQIEDWENYCDTKWQQLRESCV